MRIIKTSSPSRNPEDIGAVSGAATDFTTATNHDLDRVSSIDEAGAASSMVADGTVDVQFVEDRALAGFGEAAIVGGYRRAYPDAYRHPVLFVVDVVAVSMPEWPVLVVNLNGDVDVAAFRALPRQVQSIQNNLSLTDMDYIQFARSATADGIFRGSECVASKRRGSMGVHCSAAIHVPVAG
jgi:hypothetical protein